MKPKQTTSINASIEGDPEGESIMISSSDIVIAERCDEPCPGPGSTYINVGDNGMDDANLYDVEVLTTDYAQEEAACHHPEIPLVIATPVQQRSFNNTLKHEASLLRGCDSSSSSYSSYSSSSSSCDSSSTSRAEEMLECTASLPNNLRPEFIFASSLIPDNMSGDDLGKYDAGLILQSRGKKGGVTIECLTKDSPFHGSYIHSGDHVVAVNNLSCSDSTIERVLELIRASIGKISICVHNSQGDPGLVSSSIMKPDPTSKVSLTLKRRTNIIRIKELGEASLFNDTLLMPQQRCIQINGISCDIMSAHEAGEIISASPKRVTIVSRIETSCAVTIALFEHVAWWRKIGMGLGMNKLATASAM